MKKNIYIVLFGLLLSMGIVSCDNNSEELFDQTASERKVAAVKEYDDALKSAEKGWLFQYFPEENQKYGGYNYIVKFHQHDSVTVWSERMSDVTQPETSFYDVISYGGPVLTFNTYNSLMHEFSTPTSDEYNAKGGDYEFLLMSYENDIITLKGTKTGNNLRLIKMTETPEEYLEKVKAVTNLLEGASFEASVKGTQLGVSSNYNRFMFEYLEGGENKLVEAAFIATDKGIHFYEPVSILGITVQDLILKEETNQLISDNEEIIIDVISSPIDLITKLWSFNVGVETDRSPAVRAKWEEMYIDNATVWGESLSETILFGPGFSTTGMIMKSDVYYVQYNLIFGGVKGQPANIGMNKVEGGKNWDYYTHLMPLVDMIVDNAPYVTEVDDEENPTVAKLTSASNPDVWFVIRR